jgi:hypothetical protein
MFILTKVTEIDLNKNDDVSQHGQEAKVSRGGVLCSDQKGVKSIKVSFC